MHINIRSKKNKNSNYAEIVHAKVQRQKMTGTFQVPVIFSILKLKK